MPIAYSYIRFSSAGQADGASLSRQREASEAYAREHGLELDSSLRDLGRSAFAGDHLVSGALGGFVAKIKDGTIARGSILIIEALDRLSRGEVLDAMELLTTIVNAGITVVTLEDQNVYSRETIKAQSHLIFVLVGKMQQAHDYSARLSSRVLDGKRKSRANKLETGRPVSRMCPAWLRVVTDDQGSRYEVIPERAAVIRSIFDDISNGIGRDRIVNRLNAERVPTFDRAGQGLSSAKTGKGWHASYMIKLARNRALVGDFIPTEKNVATGKKVQVAAAAILNHFPAVIERTLFERINDNRKPAGRRGKVFRNVLMGLCRCVLCNSTMVLRHKGERRPNAVTRRVEQRTHTYLVCSAAARNAGCHLTHLYPYSPLEKAIINRASAFAKVREFGVATSDPGPEMLAGLVAQRDNAQQRIANAMNALGASPSPTVLKWLATTEAEILCVESEIAALEKRSRKVAHKVDGDELKRLSVEAEAEQDEAKRYALRARIHGILSRTVDVIDIDAEAKFVFAWFGGGLLQQVIREDDTYAHIIDGETCSLVHVDDDGSLKPWAKFRTNPSLLKRHFELREKAGLNALVWNEVGNIVA